MEEIKLLFEAIGVMLLYIFLGGILSLFGGNPLLKRIWGPIENKAPDSGAENRCLSISGKSGRERPEKSGV